LKKFPFIFTLYFLACSLPGPAHAASYIYDQQESRLTFTLKNLGVVTVNGYFKTFAGKADFDPAQIEKAFVEIVIQTASLASGTGLADKHLRSKKFFWAEKFPEIRFKSRVFKDMKNRRFFVYGDLTIRGITRPVAFETVLLTDPAAASEGEELSFRSHTFIKRKDFDLGAGGWLDSWVDFTDETLQISLEVQCLPVSYPSLPPAA
jgi:polyisoprenoid-binding protein YceI